MIDGLLHHLGRCTSGFEIFSVNINTNDGECSGRSVVITTTETIQKIHDVIMKDIRLKTHEIY